MSESPNEEPVKEVRNGETPEDLAPVGREIPELGKQGKLVFALLLLLLVIYAVFKSGSQTDEPADKFSGQTVVFCVLPFRGTGSEGSVVASRLTERLLARGCRVVEPQRTASIIAACKLGPSDLVSARHAVEVARAAGATLVVTGDHGDDETVLQCLEVATAKVLATHRMAGDTPDMDSDLDRLLEGVLVVDGE